MRTFALGILALSLPGLAAAQPTPAAPATAPAGKGPIAKAPAPCGAKIFPMNEGNTWTYEPVAPPVAPTPEIQRLSPPQPKKLVITVKSVAPKGTETLITLEEKSSIDLTKDPKKPIVVEQVVTSTVTCSARKFEVSPDSFFFAGEPGGFQGMAFDKIDRTKDTSWKLQNGGIGDAEWREDIVAHFARVANPAIPVKSSPGKLELERKFTPAQPEPISTKLGTYKAERVALVTTGRITLDAQTAPPTREPGTPLAPMELPANWLDQFWLADAVGVVQVLNAYSQMYQLTDAQLK